MSQNRKRVLKALTEAFLPLRDHPELKQLVLDMPMGRPWTVDEATSIARRMWGRDATTSIGWCGITACCENEMTEYRFWVEVFKRLKAADCGGHGSDIDSPPASAVSVHACLSSNGVAASDMEDSKAASLASDCHEAEPRRQSVSVWP